MNQIKSPFIVGMGSSFILKLELSKSLTRVSAARCSNKRVLCALCTFVDIIVNSIICVRAERTGEMFLCLGYGALLC